MPRASVGSSAKAAGASLSSFHAVSKLLARRAAVGHAQLHAQVLSRVVAASQHDAAHRVGVLGDRPAQRGRGAVVLRELDGEALRRCDFGRELRVGVRVLAAVVAHDEGAGRILGAASRKSVFLENARRRVDDAHKVVVGEILADDGSPAIGSEVNAICHGASFPSICRRARCAVDRS